MSLINDNLHTAATPPPAAHPAAWPPAPAPYTYAPPPRQPRRWPAILTGAVAGALIAAATATLITTGLRTNPDTTTTTSTTTITAAAPTPAAPTALPTAQADRQTCAGWLDAGKMMDAADAALAGLPKGMTIDDPAARNNPQLAGAIRRSGELWRQAADALQSKINAGATPVLAAAATTASKTLAGQGDSYSAFDAVGVGTFNRITNSSAAELAALCRRLAPLR